MMGTNTTADSAQGKSRQDEPTHSSGFSYHPLHCIHDMGYHSQLCEKIDPPRRGKPVERGDGGQGFLKHKKMDQVGSDGMDRPPWSVTTMAYLQTHVSFVNFSRMVGPWRKGLGSGMKGSGWDCVPACRKCCYGMKIWPRPWAFAS